MNESNYTRQLTREEYLAELRQHLRRLPKDDYDNAIAYFTEYFDEAGPENEAAVIDELGSPREAAAELVSQLLHEKADGTSRRAPMSDTLKIALIALLLSPIGWVGLILAFALIVSAGAIIFAISLSAIVCEGALLYTSAIAIVQGLRLIGDSLAAAAVLSGGGIVGLGIGVLILTLGIALCHAICTGLVALIQRLAQKRRV